MPQKGDLQQVPYSGPINMWYQSAKFSHRGYLEPQIYSPLDYVMQKQVTGFSKPHIPTIIPYKHETL
jgi:hypothetical protein